MSVNLIVFYDREISDMPGSTGSISIACEQCAMENYPQGIISWGFDQEMLFANGDWQSKVREVEKEDKRYRYNAHGNCRHARCLSLPR